MKEWRPCTYRPQLDSLEDRLPLGDALGWLVVCPAWGLAATAAESEPFQREDRAEEGASAEIRPLQSKNGSTPEAARLNALFASASIDLAANPSPLPTGGLPQTLPARERDGMELAALTLAANELGTAPSGLLRAGSRLLAAEISDTSFAPKGVLPGRGETVTPLSAGVDRATLSQIGNSAAAGQAGHVSTLAAPPPAQAKRAPSQSPANAGAMPLRFEANQGQTDAQVRFATHGPGYNLFLTASEAVLVLGRTLPASADQGAGLAVTHPEGNSAVLRIQLLAGNAAPQVIGLHELPGKVNYYLGNDPVNWHAGIATFAQVEYHEIYPGIDLLYYSRDGQLEYDFDVAAGADPGAITLAFSGADKLAVDPQGNLVVDAGNTQIRQHRPLIYQDGNGSRQEIAGNYVLEDAQRVGFQIGSYDHSRPLVIDPVLSYSTYLGGNGADGGAGIAVDPAGHVYVTGQTSSADFPTLDPFQPTFGKGLGTAFVTSLDNAGRPLYSTYLGGSGLDTGNGIAVDQLGQVTITGATTSPDFPTLDAFQPAPGGGTYDAFVTRLDTAGQLLYSTYLGGSANDVGVGVAVDALGRTLVAGTTGSHDFPTRDAFQPASTGVSNGFVTCLDPTGQPLYSTYLGGSGKDVVHGLAIDPFGHVYLTGETNSTDFPTQNAIQTTLTGFENAFVTSLDSAGQLVYSTYLGGSAADFGLAIAADQDGNAYVTGTTYSADFPTLDAFQPRLAGYENAFVTSLDSTGQLVYSTYLGGGNTDSGMGIAVDPSGLVYVTGPTNSVDFPTQDAFQSTYGGGFYDAFVTRLDTAGQILYSSYLGGRSEDYGSSIAVDASGIAYVAGSTSSANFPTQNAFQPALSGIQNAFVAMIA